MKQVDVSQSIEAERRRLAQILNDDIVSSLELLQAQTGTYLDALRGNQEAQLSLTVLNSLIQQTLQKARYVQSNLHPTVLETLGLEPALETLALGADPGTPRIRVRRRRHRATRIGCTLIRAKSFRGGHQLGRSRRRSPER